MASGIPEVDKFLQYRLFVGVPKNNQKLNMIAIVQEQGKIINAKNYPFLVIPTSNAKGRKTSQITGLYRRGHALGVDDITQPYKFRIMFVLKKSVKIPPRPFMRYTLDHKKDEWNILLTNLIHEMLIGRLTANKAYTKLGNKIVDDLKQTINDFAHPQNSKLTQERKGFDNPLIDSGILRDSITFYLIKKG
ncbi:hypothetical protein [Apilactobacillus micheneri]|uniref:hypothetical protein n=1 Tax=Apilactobacillus micheneri TaxID=1899430 RepID=UPI00112692E2|nr:hypothetical protein [Apilactobacillus micheneri]